MANDPNYCSFIAELRLWCAHEGLSEEADPEALTNVLQKTDKAYRLTKRRERLGWENEPLGKGHLEEFFLNFIQGLVPENPQTEQSGNIDALVPKTELVFVLVVCTWFDETYEDRISKVVLYALFMMHVLEKAGIRVDYLEDLPLAS